MKSNKKVSLGLIALLLLIIAGLCIYIIVSGRNSSQPSLAASQTVEENQGEYVEPEEPVDRSKNVTLPGWGGFTIPADTTEITQGFEFHNPDENLWYEQEISIGGTYLENLVVDSGIKTPFDHYLRLAGINETVAEVTSYDSECFRVESSESDGYTLEGIAGFDGDKGITVKTDKGNTVTIDVTCQTEYYYITFGLYLEENDELLYQSGLVSPGNYIQKMEMSHSLEPGTYDAYVLCQPYRSDKTTKTNQGVVRITLTAR